MLYVGLDVHGSQTTVYVMSEGCEKLLETQLRGSWKPMLKQLERLLGRFEEEAWVTFEATCGAGWLHDELKKFCAKVTVANPVKLRRMFNLKRSHDRLDAKRLAMALRLKTVPWVHVPKVPIRAWRSMIEFRRRQMGRRTAVKNAIRSLLRTHGKPSPGGLWKRAGQIWLAKQDFPDALSVCQRDLLMGELAELEERIKEITKALDAKAKAHPAVYLLMTIPGVGPRTAEAVVAYIDTAERFGRVNKVGSYFGMIPCQDQSAGKNHLGHITRQGPSVVRWLLTEAAWEGVRRSPRIRAFYRRVLRGDVNRRKIAAVATAHHLARVMLAMLKSGEVWHEAA